MPDSRKVLGREGERIACDYLKSRGYKLLYAPWERLPYGEIDIVAKYEDELVFVEVKTRSSDEFGAPEEAVTKRKLAKIELLIGFFINSHRISGSYRLDVIAIIMKGDEFELKHIQGAGY